MGDTQPEEANIHGRTLAQWSFRDVPLHQRSAQWYLAAASIGALMALYGIWTGNYVFALIIVLFGLVSYAVQRQAKTTACTIFEDGVTLGNSFYAYREIKKFWIIYNPPEVKNLYLEFQNSFKQRLPIPLGDQNPVTIRHALLDYVMEDVHQQEEPSIDEVSRLLKL